MKLSDATPADILKVALNMRESDFREFSALLLPDDRDEMAFYLAKHYGTSESVICASKDGVAIAVGAAIEARPHVITLLFFATERLPEIGGPLTRFIKHQLFPRLREAGVHRIECSSLVDHTQAHAWIRALGLKEEGSSRSYGKNREDFIHFAWVSDVCPAGA